MKKWTKWQKLLAIIGVLAVIGGLSKFNAWQKQWRQYQHKYTWPDSSIAARIPQPESPYGEISIDKEDYLNIEIYKTTESAYISYIAACKDKGFTEDYYGTEDSYSANNAAAYHLSVDYDKQYKTMNVYLTAPKNEKQANTSDNQVDSDTNSIGDEQKNTSTENSTVTPEFKQMMDSYEAFFDEYVAFMKKYENSDDVAGMMTDYANYMKKYADYMEKLNAVDTQTLSTADAAYYLEVQARIMKKLSEI